MVEMDLPYKISGSANNISNIFSKENLGLFIFHFNFRTQGKVEPI